MLGLAIYAIITILAILIIYLFGFDEVQRATFDNLIINNGILTNVIVALFLLVAGLPIIIYGIITGAKGDE